MDNTLNPLIQQYKPIPIGDQQPLSQSKKAQSAVSFKDVLLAHLDKNPQGLRFSKHAVERIERRDIQISNDDLAKIERAIDTVAAKGAKDSVLVMNNMAMVVNIDNRTVVTCINTQDQASDKYFTNIDSIALL